MIGVLILVGALTGLHVAYNETQGTGPLRHVKGTCESNPTGKVAERCRIAQERRSRTGSMSTPQPATQNPATGRESGSIGGSDE